MSLASLLPRVAVAEEAEAFAPVPGNVLVPYWTDMLDPCHWILLYSCDGVLTSVIREAWSVLGDHGIERPRRREHFEICNRPFPPGAYDEIDLDIPPEEAVGLVFGIRPTIDWDLALCSLRGPTPAELRADPSDTAVRWRLEAFATNILGDACDNWSGVREVPIGCADEASTAVRPGVPLKLVAYNWSDLPTAPVGWTWLR